MCPPDGEALRERWERVQTLLAEALELEPDRRSAFLDRACGDDAELRAEVESLVDAAESSDEYFGELAGRAGITLSADTLAATGSGSKLGRRARDTGDAPDLIGQRVGQYRVLELLGRGGMATVYLAERDGDGFTQRVALKVVSRRVSDPLIQRRSNEERRILARLEHRSIARLIDGGVTPEGFPFYAMEYVEGADVLRYCDQREMNVDERLRLFLELCAPVQFAHEGLVVHCDLKPSNIWVTPEGHVKLLDFGVARLIDPESVGSEVTGLWFTPAYASPEQVRRERPGTHSDVYSLGVILYEMLTGHRPYRFATEFRDDIAQTVGEEVPPLPSEVVTRPGYRTLDGRRSEVPASDIAAVRGGTPGEIRKRLRGDLDAIVMKALAKDKAERYGTVEQLAADLRRHLQHGIVNSVSPTPAYRLGKFVRRNRGTVVAAGVVALAIAAGVSATLWQASRATRAARAAEEEAQKAAVVAELMADLFRLSDPSQSLGDTVTARDLLDRGAERIGTEFGDQPVVQADLLTEVALIYNNLGRYDLAEPLITQALDLRTQEFGPLSLEVSESLVHLGVLQSNLSRQSDAIEVLSRAVDIREGRVPRPDPLLVEAKAKLGWAVRSAGLYDQAARLFASALEEQMAIDSAAAEIADLKFGLASSYHDEGLLEQADSIFQDVLEGVDPTSRPTPNAVSALSRVGMVRRLREQYEAADPLLAGAVDMGLRLYGSDHAIVLAARQEYALNLVGLGRWSEAERVFRDALDISLRELGPTHNVTARLQEGLGSVLEDLGRYDEAAVNMKLSLEEKVLRHENRDHPGVVSSLVAVARALALGGHAGESRDYLVQAAAMTDRLGQTTSVYTISSERTLGLLATGDDDFDEAEAHFVRAIALADELLPRPSHRFRLGALEDYADMLVKAGRTSEAIPLLREVIELRSQTLPDGHPLIEQTRLRMATTR